jgi:hypothetical protein
MQAVGNGGVRRYAEPKQRNREAGKNQEHW